MFFQPKCLFALLKTLFNFLSTNLSTAKPFLASGNDFFAPTKSFASAMKLQRFRRLALEAKKILPSVPFREWSKFSCHLFQAKAVYKIILNFFSLSHSKRTLLFFVLFQNSLLYRVRFLVPFNSENWNISTALL